MIKGISFQGEQIDFGDIRKHQDLFDIAIFPIVTSIADNQRGFDGRLHVSDLLYPVRQYALKRNNYIYLPYDVLVDRWIGTCIHKDVARADVGVHETILQMTIGGIEIVGTVDYYKDKILADYKTCKTYKAGWILNGRKVRGKVVAIGIDEICPEWGTQANMYRLLCERNGLPVEGMKIVLILKDYSTSKETSARDAGKDYVPSNIVEVQVSVDFFIEDLIINRIKKIKACQDLPNDELPLCPESSRGDKDILCQYYCDCASVCDYALQLNEEEVEF